MQGHVELLESTFMSKCANHLPLAVPRRGQKFQPVAFLGEELEIYSVTCSGVESHEESALGIGQLRFGLLLEKLLASRGCGSNTQ